MSSKAPNQSTCNLTVAQKDGTQSSVAVNDLNELHEALRKVFFAEGSVVQSVEPQPLLIVDVIGSGYADIAKRELAGDLRSVPCAYHVIDDGCRLYFLLDRAITVEHARALATNDNGSTRVHGEGALLPIPCAVGVEPKNGDPNARVTIRYKDPSEIVKPQPLTLAGAKKRSQHFKAMVRAVRETPSQAEELMFSFARQHVPRSMSADEFVQLACEQMQSVVSPGQPGEFDAKVERALSRAATNPVTERFHALAKDSTGKPLPSQANVNICIENLLELYDGLIKFNMRDQQRYVMETPPWCTKDTRPYPRPIVDADYTQICTMLQRDYEYPHASGRSVSAAIAAAAATTLIEQYDPVVDYLSTCYDAWPKDELDEAREFVETVLIRHAGAEDTPYVRAATRCWFLIAVKRAIDPGCTYREVLTLIGEQLTGKSSFFAALVPDPAWLLEDVVIERGNDRVARGLRGKWIVELPEIDKQLRADRTGEMKSFISTKTDNINVKYQEHNVDLPRSVVFGGSTNEQHMFHDATGNTRFNVVNVGNVDHEAVADERDRIWGAAARLLYDAKLQPFLSAEEQALARAKQAEHYSAPLELELLRELFDNPLHAPLVAGTKAEAPGNDNVDLPGKLRPQTVGGVTWCAEQQCREYETWIPVKKPTKLPPLHSPLTISSREFDRAELEAEHRDANEPVLLWATPAQLRDYLADAGAARVTPKQLASALRQLGWVQARVPRADNARARVGTDRCWARMPLA